MENKKSEELEELIKDTISGRLDSVHIHNFFRENEYELRLLRLAHEELLELRGYLCDHFGKFNPNIQKLQKYWNSGKPPWEKHLIELSIKK